MSSIFGDETITPPVSPEETGQDEGVAGDPESEETFEDELEGGEEADLEGGEGDEQDQEQPESDEQESSPASAGQGDGLILGKFKTQDDLAKAYLELQREFSRRTAQGGVGSQQQAPAAAAVPQPGEQPGQQQPPDYNSMFWQNFRDNPLGTIEALVGHIVNARTAPIFEERRAASISSGIQEVAKEYRQQLSDVEGLKALTEKVGELAQEFGNPELLRNPTPRILRMAAQELWGDTKAQAFEKGKQIGRTEAERTRQAKQGLGASGGARRGAEPAKSLEQEIKDGILAAGRGGGLFG
jgi:hypothetical protein